MSDQRKQVRLEMARGELDRLQNEINTWLKERRQGDALQQYYTQLNVVDSMLAAALAALRAKFNGLSQLSLGDLYARCATLERGVLWERRVWEYLRDKFDQRRDPRYQATLAAADEVVWSAYSEPFRHAGAGAAPHGPTPLPYIEPEYAPQATARGNPLAVKAEYEAEFLSGYLKKLPLPLVALPPSCVEYPWHLIYLAHEVGHSVQTDLAAGRRLVAEFATLLRESAHDAASAAALEVDADAFGERWSTWSIEVFADAFAVASAGAWTVWAMAELELSAPAAMLQERAAYPAPLVRLALLSALVRRWNLPGQAMLKREALDLPGLTTAMDAPALGQAEMVKADLACLPALAERIAQSAFSDIGNFAQLCDHSAEDFAGLEREQIWTETLRERGDESPEQTLRGARVVLRGAVAAWNEVAALDTEDEREAARVRLRERTRTLLARSHEPVRRDAFDPPAPAVAPDALGAELAELVLAQAEREQK